MQPELAQALPEEQLSWRWADGPVERERGLASPGGYQLTADRQGCTYTDEFFLETRDCTPLISMPNVFSPNGDLVNPVFRPMELINVDEPKLTILDRWGRRLLSTQDMEAGWDGTWQNQPAPEGVYFFHIEGRDPWGKPVSQRGSLTLVR